MPTKKQTRPKYYAFRGTLSDTRFLAEKMLEWTVDSDQYIRSHLAHQDFTLPLPFKLGLCTRLKDNIPDLTPHTHSYFFVSTKLKELIEELAPGAAQILEVEQVPYATKDEKHTVLDKYWLCNVRRMIDCLDIVEDHEKPLSPRYKKCFTVSATFRADRVPPECHIFRDNKWVETLYVSQHFKDEAKRRGIKGAVFTSVDQNLAIKIEAKNSFYFRDFRYA